jgi:hypothetical protein
MNKVFCSECGAKHEYSANKPKFCSDCGASMGGGVSARHQNYQEEDDDREIPSVSSIEVKLSADRPRGIKFGEIAEPPGEKSRRPASRVGAKDMIDRSVNGHKIVID